MGSSKVPGSVRFRRPSLSGVTILALAASGAATAQEQSTENLQEVVVTGSRINRANLDTPTPVTVLDSEMITSSGLNNIGDILLKVPSLSVGFGAKTSWYDNDVGATFMNLRGLGTDRTLVLVNGRRRVAGTQSSAAVDVSTIPANLVQNMEIITGGASAVYGADAVTGVINIKLKDNFDGLELTARTGMNQRGDGQSNSYGLLGGVSLDGGRGQLTFAASYSEDDPFFLRDAPYLLPHLRYDRNPANTGPADGIPDTLTYADGKIPALTYTGAFTVLGTRYTYDNQLRPINLGTTLGTYSYGREGEGYDPVDFNINRSGQKTFSTMTTFHYSLTDSVRLFTEASFAHTTARDPRVPTTMYDIPIYRDNPLLPADVAALMDANGLTQISVSRATLNHGIQVGNVDRDTYTITAGLDGTLGEKWSWEAYGQYGRYGQQLRTQNSNVTSRFLEATDVIADPLTGAPVCRSASARAAGCLPISMLGNDPVSREALSYFQHVRILNVENTQQLTGAHITGELFSLPAGPLSVAAGVEYRRESLSAHDDGLAEANLLFIDDNGGKPVDKSFTVKDAFVEVVVPLLKDLPLIHEFGIEGAVRYSDYNTIGDTTAWKLGTSWSPVASLRLRGTYSTSVRAPSLAELFSPGVNFPTPVEDPCDASRVNLSPNRAANCAALGVPAGFVDNLAISRQAFQGGNPALQVEKSDSWTVGAVFTPEAFGNRLHLTVDYWTIKIDGAINSISVQDIVERCVDLGSINNAFCPLVTRNPTAGYVTRVDQRDLNIGELTAEGVDFQGQYHFDLASLNDRWPGSVRLSLSGTYLIKNEELIDASDSSTLIIKDGELENPRWRGMIGVSYALGAVSVDWNMRYIGRASVDEQASAEFRDRSEAGARLYHDLFGNYEIGDSVSVYLGINNVLDQAPPRLPATYAGINRGALYDNLGRYFFIGGNVKF